MTLVRHVRRTLAANFSFLDELDQLSSIFYWSPLIASVVFGFSVQGIFISTYQYLIDTYELFAASALDSATFFRYIAAEAMMLCQFRCTRTWEFTGPSHCCAASLF